MVGNSSVFILFGIDQNGATQSDFHVLNTKAWTWTDTFQGLSPSRSSTDSNGTSHPDNGDGSGHGASAGTIAGAVVGSVAGVSMNDNYEINTHASILQAAIIVGLCAFCYIRKRRSTPRYQGANGKQDFERSQVEPGSAQHSSLPPPQYHLSSVDTPTIGAPYYDQHSVSSPTYSVGENNPDGYRVSTDLGSSENKPDGSRPTGGSPMRLTLQPVKPDGL